MNIGIIIILFIICVSIYIYIFRSRSKYTHITNTQMNFIRKILSTMCRNPNCKLEIDNVILSAKHYISTHKFDMQNRADGEQLRRYILNVYPRYTWLK
jgi:hypothetical protein